MERLCRTSYYEIVTALGMIHTLTSLLEKHMKLPEQLEFEISHIIAILNASANGYQLDIMHEIMITEAMNHLPVCEGNLGYEDINLFKKKIRLNNVQTIRNMMY